jgi:hypothetical protein
MKRLMIAAAALLSACTPPATKSEDLPPADAPVADAAGNRIEALTENNGRWCSGDGVWCVAITGGNAVVTHSDAQLASLTVGEAEVWPHIIRVGRDDASALIGLVAIDRQMYSGGGASARFMTLFEVAPGQEAEQLLGGIPIAAEALVRACFTEEHAAQRQDACHDEYDFNGTISLDPAVSEGPPRLILTTEATSFPGQRTRATDSTAQAALNPDDLTRWRDPVCSYSRWASRGADGGYVWNEPLPPCADYLEP